MAAIEGIITAMATPFDEAGAVDVEAGRRLAAHLLEHGSHGLVIAGSTGEGPTLTDGETVDLLTGVRAEVGDDPLLICGTGTNDTRHSRELTKMGVRATARGLKAGEFLLAAMLDRAKAMPVETLYLLTNARCAAAIHLYEKLGFRHDAAIMADYGARYARCDVAMRYCG